MVGFPDNNNSVIFWYLSAVFVISFVYYPIMKIDLDIYMNYIAPILALFILGYLGYNDSFIGGALIRYGIFYKGLLRCAGEMALGGVCFNFALRLPENTSIKEYRCFITFVEMMGYIISMIYACSNINHSYDFFILVLLAASISISFSGRSYSFLWFQRIKIPIFISELSMGIYVMQASCIVVVALFFSEKSIIFRTIAYLLFLISSAFFEAFLYRLSLHYTKKIYKRYFCEQ